LLTRRERWQVMGFLVLSVLSGFAQMVSVGSVVPFVGVLVSRNAPGADDGITGRLLETLPNVDGDGALFLLGGVVLVALLLANGLLATTQWLLIRFAWSLQFRMSRRLLVRYLDQPYAAFLARNSAESSKNVLNEVGRLANAVIVPLLRVVAFSVTGIFLMATLLWANVIMTIAVAVLLGGGYALLYRVVRTRLSRAGARRLAANTQRYKAINEAFGGIKEIKLLGREPYLLDQYAEPAYRFARAESTQQILIQIPRYALEILAVSVVLLLALALSSGSIEDEAPLLALYAFASIRILTFMRQIYQGVGSLRFNAVVVDTVYDDMLADADGSTVMLSVERPKQEQMPFEHVITLKDVSFQYENAPQPSIESITLEIPKQGFVALVGSTGAGKTTLADIILGLLRPQQGQLLIDGVAVDDANLRAWQNNLGYVPQDIFLVDDTVEANIAFGIPAELRDHDAVEAAARIANIYEFITQEMPLGFGTVVGERGIRLSGGQRQRIGIARAIYRDPGVLVLDEATSSLDQSTEAAVHQAITQVAAAKTVILIAHRLNTTEGCDTLYLLDHGRLVSEGTYESLLKNNERFRAMAMRT
jgi:ABC-type multidrug transport system fused ATPase/permease subunit